MSLSQATATALIDAALIAARAEGFGAAVAVTDPGGHLRAFQRDETAGFLAGEVVVRKAWTVASHGIPTHVWSDLIADPRIAPLANLPQMMPVGGGFPLMADGRMIGALAVSGGTYDQDRQVAETALAELGFPID